MFTAVKNFKTTRIKEGKWFFDFIVSLLFLTALEALWVNVTIRRSSGKKAPEILQFLHLDKVSIKSFKKTPKKVFIVSRIADFFLIFNLNENWTGICQGWHKFLWTSMKELEMEELLLSRKTSQWLIILLSIRTYRDRWNATHLLAFFGLRNFCNIITPEEIRYHHSIWIHLFR